MLTVLASVTDKTGLAHFLRRLEGFKQLKLIATSSTAAYLEENGFSCMRVEELTKFPEILAGRVKTLHPKVFAGILSRPSYQDRQCLQSMNIEEIDVVIVNLYKFEESLRQVSPEAEVIEQIDIGGVSLLRAAAKNFARVAVVCEPGQYERVIASLEANGGEFSLPLRKELAAEAFVRTASYDRSISAYLDGRRFCAQDEAVPEVECSRIEHLTDPGIEAAPGAVVILLKKRQELRYGENPHQAAAWYDTAVGEAPFEQMQGKEMSANNVTDAFALVSILRDIGSPGACIIKHNNPCGVAKGKDLEDAFERAYRCDPLSAFGGVYGFSERVGGTLARSILEGFVEIVLAPDFDAEALAVFGKKKNVRVLRVREANVSQSRRLWRLRDLGGFGFLLEREGGAAIASDHFTCVTETKREPGSADDVEFAWSVVKHLTSNAIIVVKKSMSLGFGIGQTSRIRSMQLALAQAGSSAGGAVLASDGFFPAVDNIEAAAEAGIKVIVQPGGSIKDEDVIAACNRAGIAMLFTGQRCFKH